ncbi:C-type lectin domain family 6 member A-like [Glandiceps talaboti]
MRGETIQPTPEQRTVGSSSATIHNPLHQESIRVKNVKALSTTDGVVTDPSKSANTSTHHQLESGTTYKPNINSHHTANLNKTTETYAQQLLTVSEVTLCKEGWVHFKSSCYYIVTDRMLWHDTRTNCQNLGGDLVKDDTPDINRFLTDLIKTMDLSNCDPIYRCNVHIGLSYKPGIGFQWVDGSDLSHDFMPWAPSEPNDGRVSRSVELELRTLNSPSLQWNDMSLSSISERHKRWSACEIMVG